MATLLQFRPGAPTALAPVVGIRVIADPAKVRAGLEVGAGFESTGFEVVDFEDVVVADGRGERGCAGEDVVGFVFDGESEGCGGEA